MWVKDPSQIPGGVWGTPGSPITMTWANALINCEALEYAGYSDWRLPNVEEMESIRDFGKTNPAIDTSFFPNARASYYWSGTTYRASTTYAWYAYFYRGVTSYGLKTNLYYVRPCRGG